MRFGENTLLLPRYVRTYSSAVEADMFSVLCKRIIFVAVFFCQIPGSCTGYSVRGVPFSFSAGAVGYREYVNNDRCKSGTAVVGP